MPNLLISNALVITGGENGKVLPNHSILVENNKIKKIAKSDAIKGKFDKEINANGRIVIPGIINAHMHFYSTLVRGLGKAEPASDFNGVLKNLWWRLDKKLSIDDSYYSALFPLIAAIKSGTTTLIDHHASPFAVTGSLDTIAKAVKETGLRSCLCYEVSDRDGDKIAEEGILENVNFIKRCQKEKDEHLTALFGLHASFTIGDKTLEKCVSLAKDLNTGFHVHTAEAKSDEDACVKEHGLRVVERFEKMGVLGKNTICVHCVHVNDKEMDILAKTGTMVVHNPQSNLNNAVGIADTVKMFAKGILVGLGTDAMTVDMREEVRSAIWAQKYKHNNPSAGFVEGASALWFNNPKIANRIWNNIGLGELKEGGAADIVMLDQYPPTPLDESNVLGHLVFGFNSAQVDTTICAGKVLMENKQLKINIDEKEAARKSMELAKSLWDRF